MLNDTKFIIPFKVPLKQTEYPMCTTVNSRTQKFSQKTRLCCILVVLEEPCLRFLIYQKRLKVAKQYIILYCTDGAGFFGGEGEIKESLLIVLDTLQSPRGTVSL